jgi:ferrous iron transport protein A
MTIYDLKVGEKAKIHSLNSCDANYRKKLLSMGLTRGTEFTLVRIAPLGDPVEISIRGFSLILRKKEASILNLEKAV